MALFAALAAWLSQASLAYAHSQGSERIAVLPVSALAVALAIGVGLAVFLALRAGAPRAPLLMLGLLLLPWMPVAMPSALLMWSGRVSYLIWIALAAALAAPWLRRFHAPGHPVLVAGGLAFIIGALSFWQASPQLPAGDEPHYLVITQSLLKDGDLRIENNHRERDYDAYFAGLLRPDFVARGRDGEIYSIHAPGVSLLVAPAFAVGGYGGAVLLALILSAIGSALAWQLAFVVSGRRDAAWFGWAAVTLSVTWIFHSFTIYPDGPGALIVLTGVWALLRAERERTDGSEALMPWFWHGAALAALPWMHTRFAVLAGGIGALVLLRLPLVRHAASKAFLFLSIPAISFLAWLTYFIKVYGTPNPAAPYGSQQLGGFEFVPDGLAGLLFDQGFGLLMYAPVLLFGFIGIGVMLTRPAWRRYALEYLFVLVPYLIVVTHFPMWWGGRSAPARFYLPVLLWMAIPSALAWTAMSRRATRAAALGALLFTAFASAVLVIARDGALAFNEREVFAQWLEWLNGSVDFAHALPMWWRSREAPLFTGIAVWSAAAVTAWLVLRRIESLPRLRTAGAFATAAVLVFAAAGSTAAAVVWATHGVSGRQSTPAQLDVLRALGGGGREVALSVSPPRLLNRQTAAQSLHIVPPPYTGLGGAGRNDRPLYSVPAIPAGEYRLRPAVKGSAGWLMIGIGRDQFSLVTQPLAEVGEFATVNFPVDVRAIVVRGDEGARASISEIALEPVRLVAANEQLTSEFARHAVRYRQATVFFLDERSYPEPEAFWVGGERDSQVVIQPDDRRQTEVLLLRNGAHENTVSVSSGSWQEELRMAPGEERQVHLPLDPQRGATLVRFSSAGGFRPSAVDPKSQDHRLLGVWVKVGG